MECNYSKLSAAFNYKFKVAYFYATLYLHRTFLNKVLEQNTATDSVYIFQIPLWHHSKFEFLVNGSVKCSFVFRKFSSFLNKINWSLNLLAFPALTPQEAAVENVGPVDDGTESLGDVPSLSEEVTGK